MFVYLGFVMSSVFMVSVCYVLYPVFVMSSVCYVLRLLWLAFVMSRVVMPRLCYV